MPPPPPPFLVFWLPEGRDYWRVGGGGGREGSNSDVADVALRILFYGVPQNELLIMIRVFN